MKHNVNVKNFCILGMPGSGKSYVANVLKHKKSIPIPILDSDSLLKNIVISFPVNFETFLKYEKSIFQWIREVPYNHILFTGGSSPLREDWIFNRYETIWLNTPLEISFDQFKQGSRLGFDQKLDFLEYSQIYDKRKNIYTKSKYVIDNSTNLIEFIEQRTNE